MKAVMRVVRRAAKKDPITFWLSVSSAVIGTVALTAQLNAIVPVKLASSGREIKNSKRVRQ